jgi:dihydrodipicolinate synthase/N-acetylneuraminate lyase
MGPHGPLSGLICPMLTPFDEHDHINKKAVKELVDYLIASGVDGLLPAGTTGEGFLMTTEERMRLAEIVVESAGGRAAVIIHTGCITTAETVMLTEHAQKIGADGASIITPYFYTLDEQELFEHYTAVARAVPGFPLSLYSFPGNAKQEITPNLLINIRQAAPQYVAIKLSSIDLIRFQEYVQAGGDEFNPLCGADALALPALSVGSRGQVSGNSNVFPEVFRRLIDAYHAGDLDLARSEQARINQIRTVLKDDLAHFKAALQLRGHKMGSTRAPLRSLTQSEERELRSGLSELGLS